MRQSLQEAERYRRGDEVTIHVTELPPPPKPLTPSQIRAIRKSFNVSQVGFARIINVSPNTVEAGNRGSGIRERRP